MRQRITFDDIFYRVVRSVMAAVLCVSVAASWADDGDPMLRAIASGIAMLLLLPSRKDPT